MEDKKKKVLVVDDEELFIISLMAGLYDYSDQFITLTAANGKKAVDILEKESVDLLVTDLKMPVMDGFELLAYVSANFPSLPAIVISAITSPQIKERVTAIGALQVIEKPVDFDELAESILKGLQFVSGGGQVDGISLASFLQLVEIEQKTCLLEVNGSGSQKGFFYFKEGELYDALAGSLTGEEAVFEMVRWEKSKMMFKNAPAKKVKKRIQKSLMSLLLEASRREDEK